LRLDGDFLIEKTDLCAASVSLLTEGVQKMNQNNTFTIHLPKFEGPFDLLLFFIERDELDIYDIPIAKITDDFLAYMHQAEAMNIDLASEFIVVAATLMRIKAKMLLPRKPLDEEGNEIDPREELVSRLLEYKQYKSVLDELRQLEEEQSQRELRGNVTQELKNIATKALVDNELEDLTLYKLLRVFERLMREYNTEKTKAVHRIYTYNYTIESQREYIFSKARANKKTDFSQIFKSLENRIHAIVTFLALLEMINQQDVRIIQGEGINNFWIALNS
jgi:segregation and condensation protein A